VNIVNSLGREFGLTPSTCNRITVEKPDERSLNSLAVVVVMMRSPHSYCVAVRKPNGEIVTEESPLPRLSEQYPIFKCLLSQSLRSPGLSAMTIYKMLRSRAPSVD
jgi:hypothetical protein